MKNREEIMKALCAPWPKEEIRWRVGALTKNKDKALPLAYVDARTVMDRLDTIMGADWQDRYEFHGNRIICYLSLKIANEWITRSDGAGDTDVESEKGGISDAFKRAGVKWGMGRELYEIKCRYMPIDKFKKLVGDPWKFVIKAGEIEDNGELDVPKLEPVKPITSKDWFLAKIDTLDTEDKFNKFMESQKNKDARDKLYLDDKQASKQVEDAIDNQRKNLTIKYANVG